jgi:acyl-CoA thioesterase
VSRWFGIRWGDPCTARFEIRDELINAGGMLSGVATYALVDYTMGSALWKETSREEAIATINISINYVRTAVSGEAVCVTNVDRRNKTSAVLRSEVRTGDGDLLAAAIGTYSIFPRRKRSQSAE